ncbi:MAG: phosphopantetheine-binding protein [Actinomycetota bacterium]
MSEPQTPTCRPARSEADVAAATPPATDVPGRLRWLLSAHLDVSPDRLEPDVRLGEDLCVDSLAAVELMMVVEDEFDISLPEAEVECLRTYGELLALVSSKAGAQAAAGA